MILNDIHQPNRFSYRAIRLFILQKIKDINLIESRETYKADLLFFQSQRLHHIATGKQIQGLKSWSDIIQKVESIPDDRTASQIESDTLKLFANWKREAE